MTSAIILNALASFAILELWFNGSIFAGLHARLEVRVESAGPVVRFISELLTCRLCLGTWVCFATCLCFPPEGIPLLLSFAAVRGIEIFLALLAAKLQPELTTPNPIPDPSYWDHFPKMNGRSHGDENQKPGQD